MTVEEHCQSSSQTVVMPDTCNCSAKEEMGNADANSVMINMKYKYLHGLISKLWVLQMSEG